MPCERDRFLTFLHEWGLRVTRGRLALEREICRAHGFSADHHQLQIVGLCRSCRERAEAARLPSPAEGRNPRQDGASPAPSLPKVVHA